MDVLFGDSREGFFLRLASLEYFHQYSRKVNFSNVIGEGDNPMIF